MRIVESEYSSAGQEVPIPSAKKRRLAGPRFMAATALVAASYGVLGGVEFYRGVGEYFGDDPNLFTNITAGLVDGSCPPISSEMLSQINAEISGSELAPKFSKSSQAAGEQAKAFGLTVVDTQPYLAKVAEDETVSDVVATFGDFMSNYGLGVELSREKDIREIVAPYQPIDLEKLNFEVFRSQITTIIRSAKFIPKELIKAANIRSIKLASVPNTENSVLGQLSHDGEFVPTTRNIIFDPSKYVGERIFAHELGHALMQSFCGWGAIRDPEMKNLNPSGFFYGQNNDSKSTAVAEAYGATNVGEDQATIIADILTLNIDYGKINPVLQAKVDLLGARLNEIAGLDIIGYYKSIATGSKI